LLSERSEESTCVTVSKLDICQTIVIDDSEPQKRSVVAAVVLDPEEIVLVRECDAGQKPRLVEKKPLLCSDSPVLIQERIVPPQKNQKKKLLLCSPAK
jgi:hypothetical protein